MPAAYGTYAIPGGDAGTHATLSHMARLVDLGAVTPTVRRVAASLALGTGRDARLQARLIRDWVDTHTEFLADPLNAEALTPPEQMITLIQSDGLVQVDCDDVAMLAASLGMSIGLRARFVVVAFGQGPQDPFAHIWTELAGATTPWVTVDPTRPVWGMPAVSRTWIMEL
jgi:transglutaminase-like putative cysteine protease